MRTRTWNFNWSTSKLLTLQETPWCYVITSHWSPWTETQICLKLWIVLSSVYFMKTFPIFRKITQNETRGFVSYCCGVHWSKMLLVETLKFLGPCLSKVEIVTIEFWKRSPPPPKSKTTTTTTTNTWKRNVIFIISKYWSLEKLATLLLYCLSVVGQLVSCWAWWTILYE